MCTLAECGHFSLDTNAMQHTHTHTHVIWIVHLYTELDICATNIQVKKSEYKQKSIHKIFAHKISEPNIYRYSIKSCVALFRLTKNEMAFYCYWPRCCSVTYGEMFYPNVHLITLSYVNDPVNLATRFCQDACQRDIRDVCS